MPDHVIVEAIAAEVLDHLRSNPRAADSLDGVRKWWLKRRGHVPAPDVVKAALTLLISRDALRAERAVDGTIIYSAR
jgi:hypothetical protein